MIFFYGVYFLYSSDISKFKPQQSVAHLCYNPLCYNNSNLIYCTFSDKEIHFEKSFGYPH